MKAFLPLWISFYIGGFCAFGQQQFKLSDTIIDGPNILRTHSVQFELGRNELLDISSVFLDSVAAFLKVNPSVVLEVGCNVDGRANPNSSYIMLSANRAGKIVDYLISKGIPSDRLVAKGYNITNPIISMEEINQMKTEDEREKAHAANRRTEFRILRIDYK